MYYTSIFGKKRRRTGIDGVHQSPKIFTKVASGLITVRFVAVVDNDDGGRGSVVSDVGGGDDVCRDVDGGTGFHPEQRTV
jgi:hypothetical protein